MKNLYLLPILVASVFTTNLAMAEDELDAELYENERSLGGIVLETGAGLGLLTTGSALTSQSLTKDAKRIEGLKQLLSKQSKENALISKEVIELGQARSAYIDNDADVKKISDQIKENSRNMTALEKDKSANKLIDQPKWNALDAERKDLTVKMILAKKSANAKWNKLNPNFAGEFVSAMQAETKAKKIYASIKEELGIAKTGSLAGKAIGATSMWTGVAFIFDGASDFMLPTKVINSNNFTKKSDKSATGLIDADAVEHHQQMINEKSLADMAR